MADQAIALLPMALCVLYVQKPRSKFKAQMRFYKQIPAAGSEAESPVDCGKQAQTWDPDELEALREPKCTGSTISPLLLDSKNARQDDSGLVPGGFLNYIFWEQLRSVYHL